MPSPPILLHFAVHRETVSSTSYHWNNAVRKEKIPVQIAQYVWSGEGVYEYQGKTTKVGPGQIMLFSSGEKSRYWYPAGTKVPWSFGWINLTGLDSFWQELRKSSGSVITLGNDSPAALAFAELTRRFAEGRYVDAWDVSAQAYQFVISLARESSLHESASFPRLDRARDFLLHHPAGSVGVKEVAAQFGYSREHFTRLYREHFGESPGTLLRRERLRRAGTLLKQSSFSLERIAELSGFGSPAALCRAFRTATGASPDQWRKKASQPPINRGTR